MSSEDWWPAEARLIYTHSLSQQHHQQEQQQQQQQQQQQHHQQEQQQQHEDAHYRQHRDVEQLRRGSANRIRSCSLTSQRHPASNRGAVSGHQQSLPLAHAASYQSPLILCRSFSTGASAGAAGSDGGATVSDSGGAMSAEQSTTDGHSIVNLGDTLEQRLQSGHQTPPQAFLVLTGGTPGSGRSALVRQFFSSDYMHGYEEPVDTPATCDPSTVTAGTAGASVSRRDLLVRVNDRPKIRLVFDDPEQVDTARWHALAAQRDQLYAFLLVYSVVDAASFDEALQLLQLIASADRHATRHHVVILVANKSDLVRARQVSTADGRRQAERHRCKFIECSGGINHRVDELLAGLATQLLVHTERCNEERQQEGSSGEHHHHHHHHKHHGFFSRLLHRRSRSCQDLFT